MVRRTTRWIAAALIASAMASVGCARPQRHARAHRVPPPVTIDSSVVHAFDTNMEVRLLDRLEMDNFLRERDINVHVADGLVSVTGEVWSALEKERVSELIRSIPGVSDVANELTIRPAR
jgi:osmotically-inducible protein OsmY